MKIFDICPTLLLNKFPKKYCWQQQHLTSRNYANHVNAPLHAQKLHMPLSAKNGEIYVDNEIVFLIWRSHDQGKPTTWLQYLSETSSGITTLPRICQKRRLHKCFNEYSSVNV